MNFDFDPDDEKFRDELRAFIRENVPAEMAERNKRGYHFDRNDQRFWARTLHDKGWGGPNWPKEWGGTGWSPMRQFIFESECFIAGAPHLDTAGFRMIGPVLMTFGSPEMKAL